MIASKLEAARQELLDLGLRNPLLNYRPLKARGVEIVQEAPAEVLARLLDGKAFTFAAAKKPAAPFEEAPPEGEAVGVLAERAAPDTKLQTPHADAELAARLLATHAAARTFIEEQGANVLFLALGFLEWKEADKPETRRAPLLLLPVELARTSALARFTLRWTGEEPGENLSLAAKLKADFGLTLPERVGGPDDELDAPAYFEAVAQAVEGRGWRVDGGATALGFFAFGKYMMYRDLDAATWPEAAKPEAHPVLAALLQAGFAEPAPALTEADNLDDEVPPDVPAAVVDLDGSQALAVLGVRGGRNLVIQGPPGTGKSQTITNMIADAVARGKTVLFVAEKMAALEVVKRRLDASGLGDACLELHSHKASKKAVLTELGRTLALGRPRVPARADDDAGLHAELRERLNAYAAASIAPVGASGLSPHEAAGEWLELERKSPGSRLPADAVPAAIADWPRATYERRAGLVAELVARLADTGPVAAHPFHGARLTAVPPGREAALRADADRAAAATAELAAAIAPLAARLGMAAPTTRDDAARVVAAAERAGRGPDLTGVAVSHPGWIAARPRIEALLADGARLAGLRRQVGNQVVPGAWEQDLTRARAAIAAHDRRFFRWLNGGWREANATIKGLSTGQPPRDPAERLALLDALGEGRQLKARLAAEEALARALFAERWAGEGSDWAQLAAIADWARDLHEEVATRVLPPELLAFLADHPRGLDAARELTAAAAAIDAFDAAWRGLVAALELAPAPGTPPVGEDAFPDLAARLARWRAQPEALQALAAFNRLAATLRDEELGGLAAHAATLADPDAAGRLPVAFRRARLEAVLARALAERPPLQQFDGAGHEIQRDRFRTLDRLVLAHTRARLSLQHWDALPRGEGAGQWATLRRELEKKARWLPIRQLIARAGHAVQAIKPVFMMSPMSIATFLPPGALAFDLVVFDEASQVKPVDAFGAIMRAGQVVVVGDKRQMPPTSFFDNLAGAGATEEPDEDEVATGDYESVLGLFEAQGAPQHMLRWHYRSRHESLIAVSNAEFYDGRLVVFPSPDADRAEAGLRFHHLPGAVYDRGGTRTNPAEARAVAEAVLTHAQARPQLSLGVAAFSVAQATAIAAEVEKLRRAHPEAEGFFTGAHAHEPFFVKNLETVQGDERDVMLVSVGYGPDASGKLAMAFGPLNLDGGERRLNVLITRARVRCEVFSSITGDMIRETGGARGVGALKRFLTYAQTGLLEVPAGQRPAAPPETAFADEVAATLEAAGWAVARGVGVEGGRVDVAVKDPDHPGRYLLGVVCDGEAYGGARTARDRDRLREQVLHGLGWRLAHAWSMDWLRRPDHERRKLLAAVEAAQAEAPPPLTPDPGMGPGPLVVERDALAAAVASPPPPPYRTAAPKVALGGRDLADLPVNVVAGWVAEVVAAESPVHVSEIVRRLAAAAGIVRPGARFKAAVAEALDFARRLGVETRGEFVWTTGMATAPLRDRSALPAASKKVELVPPEELAAALVKAVTDAHGLPAAQAAVEALKLLGFSRPGDAARAHAEAALAAVLAAGGLASRGELVVAPA